MLEMINSNRILMTGHSFFVYSTVTYCNVSWLIHRVFESISSQFCRLSKSHNLLDMKKREVTDFHSYENDSQIIISWIRVQ